MVLIMRLLIYILAFGCLTIILNSCAQIVPLTGGDRDIVAPKLIEAVPINQSLNFTGNKIVLKFDEYVQLRDIFNQFLITPQLKEQPEITVKGKSLEILFKEPLAKETTYKLYFGSSITDITENNALSNFEYVLSTGSIIDTLSLSGKVIDAYTLQGQKDALVGLYSSTDDSVIYKSKPDYITRTGINGIYKLGNIKAGAYKAVVLGDNNKNYLYDEGETIGFLEKTIKIDSAISYNFKSFKENPKKVFVKKAEHNFPEKVTLSLNTGIDVNTIAVISSERKQITDFLLKSNKTNDSLWFYFATIPDDSIYIKASNINDSSLITFQTKEEVENQFKRKRLPLELRFVSVNNGSLPYFSPITLFSSFLVEKFDPSKVIIHENEKPIVLKADEFLLKADTAYIIKKWNEDSEYTLQLLPGAINDRYNRENDTINLKFKTNSKSDYGILKLKHQLPYPNFIVCLYNSNNKCVYEKIMDAKTSELVFLNVIPDTYKIKIVVDANNDKSFTSGTYLNKKQPEEVFIYKQEIKIIADWENEIIIKELD